MPSSQFLFPEEPNANNIINILQNVYTRFQSVEEVRWNESNIDVRFYAGDQDYIYQYFTFAPNYNFKNFYFNIIRQPVLMITGYQRQHRKSVSVVPVEAASQHTADQFNKLLQFSFSKRHMLEKFSDSIEQATTSGFILLQPYLDFKDDPVNGVLDLKIWEYNSFMVDPYFRNPDMSDCNWIWLEKFLSKKEAIAQFPEHAELIGSMGGYSNRDGQFYFLPENYNIARNDLLVLSYYWYRSNRTQKRLYNRETGEISEWKDSKQAIKEYLKVFPQFEEIEVEVPTWNVAVILNKSVLYIGENPLGFDECPFVPVYWDYEPWQAQYNLRVRSFVRYCRDVNFLFNRRIILNHDISESSINSGWMYRENSIVNEENINYAGQGKHIIVKDDANADKPLEQIIQKIIPNAVPPSDMALADQMQQLMSTVSCVTPELLGASDEKGLAGITEMLRQGAGLVTLQKYYDQWDRSLKLVGMLCLRIIQSRWTPFKVSRIIKEQPTQEFYDKNFSQYDVLPEESLNTTTQKQQQFVQLLRLREMGIPIPTVFLLKNSTLQGKDELIESISSEEQQQSAAAKEKSALDLAILEGQLQNLQANTAEKLAMARERVGRTKSNIGLFEERLAEVSKNHATATKEKISAIKEFLDTVKLYGEVETMHGADQVDRIEASDQTTERVEKQAAKQEAATI
jgi:hypothetical protein